jgi:hypothetical protein
VHTALQQDAAAAATLQAANAAKQRHLHSLPFLHTHTHHSLPATQHQLQHNLRQPCNRALA